MLGKIAGALIGERIAGKRKGAKGAILGVLAETLIKKAVPTVAAVAVLGFAYRKAKRLIDGAATARPASYPSEAGLSPDSSPGDSR
jgi:hypothetical protein